MDIATDLSEEAMAIRWGGILNEIPELWDAIRHFEIKNRPTMSSSGFNLKADWVSVYSGPGSMLRLKCGNSGR